MDLLSIRFFCSCCISHVDLGNVIKVLQFSNGIPGVLVEGVCQWRCFCLVYCHGLMVVMLYIG